MRLEKLTLTQGVDRFLDHISPRTAPATVGSYRGILRALVRFHGDGPLRALRQHDIDAFLASRREPHEDARGRLSPGIANLTFNHYVTRLKVFFEYCFDHELISRDLGRGLRRARAHHRARQRLTPAEVVALMDAMPGARERAVVAVAFFTAVRKSELTSMRVGDVDLQAGTLFIRVWKSGLEDTLPIGPELRSEMVTWLNAYERRLQRELKRGLLPTDFLIPANKAGNFNGSVVVDGKRIHRFHDRSRFDPEVAAHAPQRFVNDGLRKIGLYREREGMHTLRRSAARIMFDTLMDDSNRYDSAIRIVQSLLHHASSETTERYIGLSRELIARDDFLRNAVILGLSGQAAADRSVATWRG